jgi:hypothetical protein
MQVFKLVRGGFVDNLIAFDSLPERLLKGIRTRDMAGLPRYWANWLKEKGSVRPVFKTQTEVLENRNLKVTHTPNGEEPCFWILEFQDLNQDKEKWSEISSYVRQAVDTTVRLKDRIEDMAKPMAPDSKAPMDIEPDDIPVIGVPAEVAQKAEPAAIRASEEVITPTGDSIAQESKRRGRPKKVAVEA